MARPRLSGRFVGATAVAAIAYLGVGLIAPLLPALKTSYGLTNLAVGVTLGAFAAGRAFASAPAGLLIDRHGAKMTAVAGCALGATAAVAAIGARSYLWLVVAVGVQGLGAALSTTAAMTAVLSDAPSDRVGRYMSWHFAVVLASISLAPLISGFSIAILGAWGPFLIYTIGLTVAAVVVAAGSWGDDRPPSRDESDARWRGSPDDRRAVVMATIATFVLFATIAGVLNTLLPILASEIFAFTEPEIGYLLTSIALGNLAIVHLAGKAADHTGRRPVIVWGMVAMGAGSVLLAASEEVWMVFVIAVALGVARGYVNIGPLAVIADVVPAARRGWVVGVTRTAAAAGLAIGPILAGRTADVLGLRPAFAVAGAAVVAIGLAMSVMPETLGRGVSLEEMR